jgi:hypothetical protein
MSLGWVVGSRVLLLFTGILVLVMPWTEYFWHFDHFLRGGQDFELSLLFVSTILGLVLVLLKTAQRAVALFFRLRRLRFFRCQHDDPSIRGSFCGLIADVHAEPLPSAVLRLYNLPIQI